MILQGGWGCVQVPTHAWGVSEGVVDAEGRRLHQIWIVQARAGARCLTLLMIDACGAAAAWASAGTRLAGSAFPAPTADLLLGPPHLLMVHGPAAVGPAPALPAVSMQHGHAGARRGCRQVSGPGLRRAPPGLHPAHGERLPAVGPVCCAG